MKRTILVILMMLFSIALAGCSNDTEAAETTEATQAAETSTVVKADWDYENFDLQLYENDIKATLTEEELEFISERFEIEFKNNEEHNLVAGTKKGEDSYYCTCFYPVLKQMRENMYALYYTDDKGAIYKLKEPHYKAMEYEGNLNYDYFFDEKTEVIEENQAYAYIYFRETGEIKVYERRKATDVYNLPEESIYAGFSYWVGHIFRSGDDVYAFTKKEEIVPIAHGVQAVIEADYELTSDAWSQPLFLMNDGTLKAYCNWKVEKEGWKTDDPRLLEEVVYEGGWH